MKIVFLIFVFVFICSFTGLFCSENPDVSNYVTENETTNFTFSLPNNFENNLDLFKSSKYDKTDPDYKTMIKFKGMGVAGIVLLSTGALGWLSTTAIGLLLLSGTSISFTKGVISIILLGVSFIFLGVFCVLGLIFILHGFVEAAKYKKLLKSKAITSYNSFENKSDKLEFAIDINL